MPLLFDDRYQVENPVVSTTQFTIGFDIYSLDGVDVYVDEAQLLTSEFTVTGTATDGVYTNATVTLNTAVTGKAVWIVGNEEPEFPDDLINGPNLIPNLNEMFGRKTAEIQELYRNLGLALKVPLDESSIDTTLPPFVANRYLMSSTSSFAYGTVPGTLTQPDFATQAAAGAATIDAAVDHFRVAGHTTHGDGGHGLFFRVGAEPSHEAKIQSADGAWWEYAPDPDGVNAGVFGVFGDGVTNNTTPLQNAINFAADGNYKILLPRGIILLNGAIYCYYDATNNPNFPQAGSKRHTTQLVGSGRMHSRDWTNGRTQGTILKFASGTGKQLNLTEDSLGSTGTITGLTNANPGVVTATAHPFSNGDTVKLTDVGGMTEVNGNQYTVANATANTFDIGTDTTSFGTYTSGGTATEIVNTQTSGTRVSNLSVIGATTDTLVDSPSHESSGVLDSVFIGNDNVAGTALRISRKFMAASRNVDVMGQSDHAGYTAGSIGVNVALEENPGGSAIFSGFNVRYFDTGWVYGRQHSTNHSGIMKQMLILGCQAKACNVGLWFRWGVVGVKVVGSFFEQNDGADIKISDQAERIEIESSHFASTDGGRTANLVLGDNTGNANRDACNQVSVRYCTFNFCGPATVPAVRKYKEATNVEIRACGFKNNGGYGIMVDDDEPAELSLLESNYSPLGSGSELGAANRVVHETGGTDARYRLRRSDASTGRNRLASNLDMSTWRHMPDFISANTLSGNVTVTLPTDMTLAYDPITVYKNNGANDLIVEPTSNTIEGHDPVTLEQVYASITLTHDASGTGWQVLESKFWYPTSEVTISGGVISVTDPVHTVDTEADASTDDLDTINGGVNGQRVLLRAAASARTVVVKHGTGNINLDGQADFSLTHAYDMIELFNFGGQWRQISASNNEV